MTWWQLARSQFSDLLTWVMSCTVCVRRVQPEVDRKSGIRLLEEEK